MKINPSFKYISFIIVTVVAYSGFRSLIDHVDFIISLDKVISTIFSEVWNFISSPSIFIALLVFFVIWIFRDSIRVVFPAINEISAAGITAKFSYAKIESKISQAQQQQLQKSTDNSAAGEVVLDGLILKSGIKTQKLLLKINKKKLTFDQLVDEFQKSEMGLSQIESYNADVQRGYYLGTTFSFYTLALPYFLSINLSDDSSTAEFILKPWAKKKLMQKIKNP